MSRPDGGPPLPEWFTYDVLLHNRCGRKLSEHPMPHAPSVRCPFPALPPVDFRPAAPAAEADSNAVAVEDVRQILAALGIGTHARPYSAHDVVQREVLPALRGLVERVAEAARLRAVVARVETVATTCRTMGLTLHGVPHAETYTEIAIDLQRALEEGTDG